MRRPPPTLCKTSIKLFELLARDPRTSAHSPDWIRQTMVLGYEKRRIVRYVLDHTPSNGSPPRLLDVGAQIGAFALYAARSGGKVAAVDYELFHRNLFADSSSSRPWRGLPNLRHGLSTRMEGGGCTTALPAGSHAGQYLVAFAAAVRRMLWAVGQKPNA